MYLLTRYLRYHQQLNWGEKIFFNPKWKEYFEKFSYTIETEKLPKTN